MGREWIEPFQMFLKPQSQVQVTEMSLDQVMPHHADIFRDKLGNLSVKECLHLKPGAKAAYYPA